MPAERALRHVPILLLDAAGFTRLAGVEERRAALRVLQDVLTEQARFFMPFGEVWEKWVRHGTGAGYYFVFDALPVRVALSYAVRIGEALAARPSADLPLRVRMVLAVGDVEWVGDQILSDAFAVAERLISHPPFKRFAEAEERPWALASTRLFHHELDAQPAPGFEDLDDLGWTAFTAVDKHGTEHPGYVLGPGFEPTTPATAEPTLPRVSILVGHSLDDPLPEAVELAHHALRAFAGAGRAVELRIDQATTAALVRELQRGCDLLVYYGHGSSDGHLLLADGRLSFAQLDEVPRELWERLGACFVFACHGERFAEALPCPWLAFTEPILRLSPRPFLHALVSALGAGKPLHEAVEAAKAEFADQNRERSGFLDALLISDAPIPALAFEPGEATLSRLTAGLADRARVDFAPASEYGYPDHDPFVGRVSMLQSLLDLPSPALERPLQRVVWVHGDPGMGKSALLRQLAMTARDLVFHDPDDPVWVLHLHAHKHSRPETLLSELGEGVRDLYGLEEFPVSADGLARALRDRPGRHLWILDDLTYLEARPDATEARDLVASLKAAAGAHAVPLQLVVSSRRSPPAGIEATEVTALDSAEARLLARMVCHQYDFEPPSSLDLDLGAARLFHLVRGLTVHYKRSLTLAVERGIGFLAYADSLGEDGSLEDLEAAELAVAMVRHELRQLENLEPRHGFAYRAFLGLYYPLIARAARFTVAELAEWFGDAFCVEGSSRAVETAYRTGVDTLTRLGFCWRERSPGCDVYTLPPNQRQVVRALADQEAALPGDIPLRGVQERLSLALEGTARREWEAMSDLLEMEWDYRDHLSDPEAAVAAFNAKQLRAAVEGWTYSGTGPHPQIAVADEVLELYDAYREAYGPNGGPVEEAIAQVLFDKGVILGKLGRSNEAIGVYDDLLRRLYGRTEPALEEQLAKVLFNKGVILGQLSRCDQAIDVYDDLLRRFDGQAEPALEGLIAQALVNKAVILGQLSQRAQAISTYDALLDRFLGRSKPHLSLQVAKALLGKGVEFLQLERYDEAIAAFDELIKGFADRPEPSVAENVAKAIHNKSVSLYRLQQADETASTWERLFLFLTEHGSELRHLRKLALEDMAETLEALDRSEAAEELRERFQTPRGGE